jgi:hypothetical protein
MKSSSTPNSFSPETPIRDQITGVTCQMYRVSAKIQPVSFQSGAIVRTV